MKRLIAALLLSTGTLAPAQTTYNLSPFNSQVECQAAAQKLGTGYVCGTTFASKPVVLPSTLTLINSTLPAAQDTTGKASIGYVLNGPAKVWCRRDTFAPVLCPNPFVLGASSLLPLGPHSVDFYLANGTVSPDMASPAVPPVKWTVVAAPVAPPPVVVTPPPTSATPLAALAGFAGACSTQVPAPGSGKPINLNRITSTQTQVSGGARCETFYDSTALVTGHHYWMAFVYGLKSGEALPSTSYDSSMVVMQTHTPAAGDTYPPFALNANGQGGGVLYWTTSYQDNPQGDANGWLYAKKQTTVHTEPLPPPDTLYRYVVHFVPQWSTTAAPAGLLEVWRAKPGQAYEKTVTFNGANDYNTSLNMWPGYSYPRIGPYNWSPWSTSSIAVYLTPIYFGEGANLLANAQASLAGY